MKLHLSFAVLALSCGVAMAAGDTSQRTAGDKPATADSSGTTANTAYLIDHDRSFMEQAAYAGNAEVEQSRLAVQTTRNAEVRRFAEQMIKDHTQANAELISVARQHDIKLPTTVDDAHRKVLDQLGRLASPQFDTAYMNQMIADHEQVITLFTQQSASGKNDVLRAWASKKLPHLQDHLNLAREIRKRLK